MTKYVHKWKWNIIETFGWAILTLGYKETT